VSRNEIVVVIKQGRGRVIISKKDSIIYGKFSPICEKKRGGGGGGKKKKKKFFFEKKKKKNKFFYKKIK